MRLPRKHLPRLLVSSLAAVALVFVTVPALRAQANIPLAMHEGVGVDEKAGESIDLDLTFINETGQKVPLRQYFSEGKPVLLNLVYYRCPMLCNLVLNGQTETMRKVPWEPGADYTVLTISIDPTETSQLAREKRAVYLSSYGKPAPGWHFFSDDNGNAKKLAEQIGFKYKYDPRIEQYSHPSVITILTPHGKVSRYLYGIQYKPLDLRLALAEAKQEHFSFSAEQLLLLCYHYDPAAGSYVVFAMTFMRIGALLIVILIAFMIYRLRRQEKARGKLSNQELVTTR
ncbi:MAG: SCO family protein [Bryobacterales bacterium]|nr:SCO family protein [Bryobacterales bacterium]